VKKLEGANDQGIVLRRFKRFHEERFDLSGMSCWRVPTLCKTTVLQAVAAWALALKTWRQLNDYQRHGGAYTKAPMPGRHSPLCHFGRLTCLEGS